MVIVIVNSERNPRTGRTEPIVSHGIDTETDRVVIMPNEHPARVGAVFDSEIGEYILV